MEEKRNERNTIILSELTHVRKFLQELFFQIDVFPLSLGLIVIRLQIGNGRPPHQMVSLVSLLGVYNVVGDVGHVLVHVLLLVRALPTEQLDLSGGDVVAN